MADVAEIAGVSTATVSFVVNGLKADRISPETIGRVTAAIKQVGYHKHATAAALATGQTRTIGFVSDVIATSQFAGDLIKGAHEAAWQQDKLLMLVSTEGAPEVEQVAIRELSSRVDGVIYARQRLRPARVPEELKAIRGRVLLNCWDPALPATSVIADEVFGGEHVTETLIGLGHRRVAFICGIQDHPSSERRVEGYALAHRKAGLPLDEALISYGTWWPETGYAVAKDVMRRKKPPTAIFCGNDRIAIGAYLALKEIGARIPQDVAVIGYDGEEISGHLEPPLTTFTIPHEEMGREAAMLLCSSDGETRRSRTKMIRGRLIERSSHKA